MGQHIRITLTPENCLSVILMIALILLVIKIFVTKKVPYALLRFMGQRKPIYRQALRK